MTLYCPGWVYLNVYIRSKKLQFGKEKCVKLHVGADKNICPDNLIDTWELKAKNKVTSILDLEDVESEKHCMEKVSSWTYLGDVIQKNGKNYLNIQNRIQRGAGPKPTRPTSPNKF